MTDFLSNQNVKCERISPASRSITRKPHRKQFLYCFAVVVKVHRGQLQTCACTHVHGSPLLARLRSQHSQHRFTLPLDPILLPPAECSSKLIFSVLVPNLDTFSYIFRSIYTLLHLKTFNFPMDRSNTIRFKQRLLPNEPARSLETRRRRGICSATVNAGAVP